MAGEGSQPGVRCQSSWDISPTSRREVVIVHPVTLISVEKTWGFLKRRRWFRPPNVWIFHCQEWNCPSKRGDVPTKHVWLLAEKSKHQDPTNTNVDRWGITSNNKQQQATTNNNKQHQATTNSNKQQQATSNNKQQQHSANNNSNNNNSNNNTNKQETTNQQKQASNNKQTTTSKKQQQTIKNKQARNNT